MTSKVLDTGSFSTLQPHPSLFFPWPCVCQPHWHSLLSLNYHVLGVFIYNVPLAWSEPTLTTTTRKGSFLPIRQNCNFSNVYKCLSHWMDHVCCSHLCHQHLEQHLAHYWNSVKGVSQVLYLHNLICPYNTLYKWGNWVWGGELAQGHTISK